MQLLPAWAQRAGDSPVLVLPLSSELTADEMAPGMATEMARVITSPGRPLECIAPVSVTRIDGQPSVVSAKGFLIEPGTHAINGRATLDTTNCPLTGSNPIIGTAMDLEVDFEPGNTYHIGYYHAPADPQEWKLVVWHIEDNRISEEGTR